MHLFTSWMQGQPWWVTLLLLPALVLAAAAERVVHYALLALGAAVVLGVLGASAYGWRRSRRRVR